MATLAQQEQPRGIPQLPGLAQVFPDDLPGGLLADHEPGGQEGLLQAGHAILQLIRLQLDHPAELQLVLDLAFLLLEGSALLLHPCRLMRTGPAERVQALLDVRESALVALDTLGGGFAGARDLAQIRAQGFAVRGLLGFKRLLDRLQAGVRIFDLLFGHGGGMGRCRRQWQHDSQQQGSENAERETGHGDHATKPKRQSTGTTGTGLQAGKAPQAFIERCAGAAEIEPQESVLTEVGPFR